MVRAATGERTPVVFPYTWFITAALVTIGCGLGYIIQMNGATARGYEIKQLESLVVELRTQNAKLGAELSQLRSMQNIEAAVKMMGLVDVGEISFLVSPPAEEVAVAR